MKKPLRYLLGIFAASIVVTLTITGLFIAYRPASVHADGSCIQYGAFLRNVSFIEAQQQGFFAKEGLSVCYNQVTSSTQQFNSLLSGQYDIIGTTADNVVNRYVNAQLPVEIVAGSDQGAGLDLIVNTANGIHTIADLKGKTVAVDAPNSGYVFALEKILAANGLSLANNDYSLQIIGGSAQRFAAISAGKTSTGDPVYATILGTPFSEQVPNVPTLSDIAKFSSYVQPYQGTTIATTQNYANTNSATVTNFIAANILGQTFAANPANRATVLADIASVDNVSPSIAANIYNDSILDLTRGENIAERVNECGLVNTINLRQEFGGFTTTVDSKKLAKPGKNSLYDDRYWKKAVKQALS
jgi:ABC-type nitrate/sulfonate/bicarbonate transport system substrate-binding protein